MSVVLGIVPVIVAWLYSEYLHYAKHSVSAKTYVDTTFLSGNELLLWFLTWVLFMLVGILMSIWWKLRKILLKKMTKLF